jgi:hypothetical protein
MEACDTRQRRVGKPSGEAGGKPSPNLRTREHERGDRYRPDHLSVLGGPACLLVLEHDVSRVPDSLVISSVLEGV